MALFPVPKHRAMDVTAPADDPAVAPYGERAIARIQDLVIAAARAIGTDGAAVVLTGPGAIRGTFCEGFAPSLDPLDALGRAAFGNRTLLVERTERGDAVSEVLRDAGLGFFASVRIGSESAPEGYLAVYAADSRSLSGAQEYVLTTFATEIADQLELGELRALAARTGTADDRREQRLRLLESVVVNAKDAVLITEAAPIDLPGPRIVYANAAFTRTTGWALHEIAGLTPRILQGPGTAPAARARLRDALRTWQPVEVELLNYHKDKTPFWVELSIVPVADETGNFTHWVSVQRDVTARKTAELSAVRAPNHEAATTALEYKAYHDELTGLRNRSYLNDSVNTSLERLKRGGSHFAVLFFDVDAFKLVNDSLGHRIGDLLLIEIARRLERCTRSQDTLARIGGDEFTCVIETDDIADAVAVANRILLAMREPVRLAGRELFTGLSVGIAYAGERYENAAEILRDADTAMYRAKRNGGMRFELFEETMHERALAALRVQMDLRSALDRGELRLHYQPIVDLDAGTIDGFEALVRWQHPEHGLIMPADFIPVAEETGLIVEIGAWVLREACRRTREWQASDPERASLKISVNVSSRQLYDPRFFADLEGALGETGLDPATLQLEIKESIFLAQGQDIATLLERIRALGVRIALDDFGTGYSSLSYLERFRVDTLKVDKSFVDRLLTTRATGEIVRLIVGLANALGMDVVAEGVEEAAQLRALREYGAARAQGYLFSRPVPESDVLALLKRPLGYAPLDRGWSGAAAGLPVSLARTR
jgi:diguanylate cyclase (GGDEF)-like protein/PAS domain S-box-containing protein